MALYFFHLCDGCDTLIDPDGRNIADESQIAEIALQEARAIISHDALGGRIEFGQFIDVRDSTGRSVCRISFRDAVSVG